MVFQKHNIMERNGQSHRDYNRWSLPPLPLIPHVNHSPLPNDQAVINYNRGVASSNGCSNVRNDVDRTVGFSKNYFPGGWSMRLIMVGVWMSCDYHETGEVNDLIQERTIRIFYYNTGDLR